MFGRHVLHGILGLLGLLAMVRAAGAQQEALDAPREFFYDRADRQLGATMLDGNEFYDPGIATGEEGMWVTWLEFVPGHGDRLWVGCRESNAWVVREPVPVGATKIARPTLTVDVTGSLWLSYEAWSSTSERWDIFLRRRLGPDAYSPPRAVYSMSGNAIRHRTAADPRDGLWVVWQADRQGQFDIMARRMVGDESTDVRSTDAECISDSPRGDWHPDIAVTPDGDVHVAWDAFDGESFNVLARRRVGHSWHPTTVVAAKPEFEGRASIVCDRRGRLWVLWEEGSRRWGMPYIGRPGSGRPITDTCGPLHRFRTLHVAQLEPDGTVRKLVRPLPMPSLDKALSRANRGEGVHRAGTFYERGRLCVDSSDRLWVVYRHFYRPQVGLKAELTHHVEQGWQLFARCLEGGAWSELYALDILQRDGAQRLSVAPSRHGLVAAWTTGRTDRREDPEPRGVAVVAFDASTGDTAASEPKLLAAEPPVEVPAPKPVPEAPATVEVAGTTYHLVQGDLHRHTDLSLCYPFLDGSLDDAYRYAIDVVRHDFFGITDHTRDIAHGDVLSQLWWRCTKEVTRHRLSKTFFPYFSYERSHGSTDHNVISLRDDRIRDFPPPLWEFWEEIEGDMVAIPLRPIKADPSATLWMSAHNTITIPHAPINRKAWEQQDDCLRPLVEIYQGFRDVSMQKPAHDALDRGYRLGFIASSDHLSTAASFACVWTPEVKREAVFRAMQARRTFGATDRIRLVFRSGDHWMGERFTTKTRPEFQIEIDGTAPIEQLVVYDNGQVVHRIEVPRGEASVRATYLPAEPFDGGHYIYIHAIQSDGNQAWSSPLWVD